LTALITGGTSGIGRAAADKLAELGVHVLVVGAPADPIEAAAAQLLFGRRSIYGWSAGIPTDSEDTLRFAEMRHVRPMIEKYPLAKAGDAYNRMLSGKAEFRVVLTM
jgi:D-arabinose 1-dehydrogenase-like Zn-dependent alcohol dehydrogenase